MRYIVIDHELVEITLTAIEESNECNSKLTDPFNSYFHENNEKIRKKALEQIISNIIPKNDKIKKSDSMLEKRIAEQAGNSILYHDLEILESKYKKNDMENKKKREAFKGCQFLSKVLLPECTMIEKSAFYGCQSLSKIELPECTTIAEQAFSSCIALKKISFPKCTSIGAKAFDSCKSLSRVYVPDCKSIGSGAFGNTDNISVFEASNDCIYGSSNFSVLDPIYPTPDGQV